MVEMTEVKIAIMSIIILEIAVGVLSYYGGNQIDMGTIGMGITAIAGLAGYDMAKKANP